MNLLLIFSEIFRETVLITPNPEKYVHPYLLHAQWTPRGHGLVMVQDYDIYYKTSPSSNSEFRVTDTAVPGIVSNGFPDWLYEGSRIRRASHQEHYRYRSQ